MSSYQLGRVGITLLGLYFLVQILLAGVSLVETFSRLSDPSALSGILPLLLLAVATLIFTVFGLLPAWILIRNRDALARRWFSDGDDGSLALSPSQLVEVGLVLLGVYLLVMGVISGITMAFALATLRAPTEEGEFEPESRTDFVLDGGGVNDLVMIAAGAFLLRFAKPLSARWIA